MTATLIGVSNAYVAFVDDVGRASKDILTRPFKFLWKHKLATALVVMALFVFGLLVMDPIMTPTAIAAGEDTLPSPASYANAVPSMGVGGACNYLMFCRWASVSAIPSPTMGFTNIAIIGSVFQLWFANIFMAIAAMIMIVVGFVMVLAGWVDISSYFVYKGDQIFAGVSNSLMFSDNPGSSEGLKYIIFGSLGFMVVWYLWTVLTNNRGKQMFVRREALTTIFFLVLCMIMGFQATKNHSEYAGERPLSSIGNAVKDINADGTKGIVKLQGAGSDNPKNWAPFSPGWFITGGQLAISWVGNVATTAITDMGEALTPEKVPDPLINSDNACASYTKAMHGIFYKTNYAKTSSGFANTIVKYDDFMQRIYFNNWRLMALGNSVSSANSWCRLAELSSASPAGDQVFISREAGLYKEAINTQSLLLYKGEQRAMDGLGHGVSTNTDDTAAAWVTRDGEWVTDNDKNKTGTARAVSVFGPVFPNDGAGGSANEVSGGEANSSTKAPYVWAICTSRTDGLLEINNEWKSAEYADPATDGKWSDQGKSMEKCREALGVEKNLGSGRGVPEAGFGFNKDGSNEFAYFENKGFMGGLLFGIGGTSNYKQLGAAPIALQYYVNTTGLASPTQSLVSGIITVALIGYVGKTLGGLTFAGFLGAQVANLALVFSFIMVFLMIFPWKKLRHFVGGMYVTIVSGLLVFTVVSLILTLILTTADLFMSMFGGLLDTTMFTVSVFTVLVNGLLIVAAVAAWSVLLKKFHLTNAKDIMAISGATIAPLARAMGYQGTANPWDRDFVGRFYSGNNPFKRSDEATVAGDKKAGSSQTTTDTGGLVKKGVGAGAVAAGKMALKKNPYGLAALTVAEKVKKANDLKKKVGLIASLPMNAQGKADELNKTMSQANALGLKSPVTRTADGKYMLGNKAITNPDMLAWLKLADVPLDTDKSHKPGAWVSSDQTRNMTPGLVNGKEGGAVTPPTEGTQVSDNSIRNYTAAPPTITDPNGKEQLFGINESRAGQQSASQAQSSFDSHARQAVNGAVVDENLTPVDRADAVASAMPADQAAAQARTIEEMSKARRVAETESGAGQLAGFMAADLGMERGSISANDAREIASSIATDGSFRNRETEQMLASGAFAYTGDGREQNNVALPESQQSMGMIADEFRRASAGSALTQDQVAALSSTEGKTEGQIHADRVAMELGASSVQVNQDMMRQFEAISAEMGRVGSPHQAALDDTLQRISQDGVMTAQSFDNLANVLNDQRSAMGEGYLQRSLDLDNSELGSLLDSMDRGQRAEFMGRMDSWSANSLGASGMSQESYVEAIRQAAFDGIQSGSANLGSSFSQDMLTVRRAIEDQGINMSAMQGETNARIVELGDRGSQNTNSIIQEAARSADRSDAYSRGMGDIAMNNGELANRFNTEQRAALSRIITSMEHANGRTVEPSTISQNMIIEALDRIANRPMNLFRRDSDGEQ